MHRYAVRVPLWMVHKLPQILDAFVNTGRVAKMQRALECAWRLHWWVGGGRPATGSNAASPLGAPACCC